MASGLRSAEVKLIRAAKQLRTLKKRVAAYARGKPHRIVKKPKGKKKLNVPKSPPLEISLLAGEIVYHMRSALDHLVFDLVKGNPQVSAIDPEWEEHCEFPLRLKLRPGQEPPLPKAKFAGVLPGIADDPFAFIERVQPYYGLGATNNALRFLGHLSNIDKHRRLNLTRARIRQYEIVRYPHGLSSRGYATLDRGAEIRPAPPMRPLNGPINAEPQKPMHVKRHYRTLVAFNERRYLGEATGLTVDGLLEIILERITTDILPEFRKFLKKP